MGEDLDCKKKYYQKNKDKILDRQKKYRQENKDKIIGYQKKYRQENKDKIIGYKKKYRQENKDKIAKSGRKYRQENKDKIAKSGRKYYQENKDKIIERQKKYYQENKEKISRCRKKYYQENKEKISRCHKKYYQENKDRVVASYRVWSIKARKTNPRYRLRRRISSLIGTRLRNKLLSKEGKSTFSFLPYTVDDLKNHLESLFEPWMSWDNYGKEKGCWSIDHIIPESSFKYNSVDDEEFQKCWALENLRPLDHYENIKKGNKIIDY